MDKSVLEFSAALIGLISATLALVILLVKERRALARMATARSASSIPWRQRALGLAFIGAVILISASVLWIANIGEVQRQAVPGPTKTEQIGNGGRIGEGYISGGSVSNGYSSSGTVTNNNKGCQPAVAFDPATGKTSPIGNLAPC